MKFFRMSYKAKTILSNSLFLISIFVLIFMIFRSQTVNIDFGEQEIKGNKLQVELMKVLNKVIIHKHAKNPKEIETQITEDLKLVSGVMKEYGEDLQFTEEGLKKRGREAFDYPGLESLIKDLFETKKITHRNVINHILTMITHAGDTSNLILDPDLDSYYLMDVTLLAVPLFIDKSAYIFDDLIENAGKDVSTKKTEYAVYSSRLTDDFNRIGASLKTAINEDPNFYGKSETLAKLNEEFLRVEVEFKKTTDLLNQTTLPEREKIMAQKENLSTLVFSFWSNSEKELSKLLETRVQKLKSERLLDIGIALVVALIGIVFTIIVNFRASEELREYLDEFKGIIDNVNQVSNTVNETFNSLSSAAQEQASAVQETASTLEEINQTVAKNSDNANSTSKLFSESYDKVNQGKKTLEQVLHSMGQISEANEKLLSEFDENSKRIEEIAQSIQEISNKTQIINDIVFQTKLLSFNASVEAARAGEMGKGFAVVAEEVGNLAQMSGNASKDIGEMVLKSIESANKIAEKTRDNASKKVDEFKTKIQKGIRTTEECNEIFQVIVENIGQLNGLLEEFRISAKEQASGVSNITSAMENIDQTLNTNNKELTHSVQGITELQLKLTEVSKELKRLERYIWGV